MWISTWGRYYEFLWKWRIISLYIRDVYMCMYILDRVNLSGKLNCIAYANRAYIFWHFKISYNHIITDRNVALWEHYKRWPGDHVSRDSWGFPIDRPFLFRNCSSHCRSIDQQLGEYIFCQFSISTSLLYAPVIITNDWLTIYIRTIICLVFESYVPLLPCS